MDGTPLATRDTGVSRRGTRVPNSTMARYGRTAWTRTSTRFPDQALKQDLESPPRRKPPAQRNLSARADDRKPRGRDGRSHDVLSADRADAGREVGESGPNSGQST